MVYLVHCLKTGYCYARKSRMKCFMTNKQVISFIISSLALFIAVGVVNDFIRILKAPTGVLKITTQNDSKIAFNLYNRVYTSSLVQTK